MSYIEEDKLGFHFAKGWEVAKYDDQPIYVEINKGCPGTKGVDFVATNGKSVMLIEVKDFRLGRVQNRDLEAEIPAKVRDTCAGLIALSRRSDQAIWQKVGASIVDRTRDLFIVLWLEEDKPSTARQKAAYDLRQKLLKKSLRWMSTGKKRVAVMSRETLGSDSFVGIQKVVSLAGASTATNPIAGKTK